MVLPAWGCPQESQFHHLYHHLMISMTALGDTFEVLDWTAISFTFAELFCPIMDSFKDLN